jgi:hypothetical protein
LKVPNKERKKLVEEMRGASAGASVEPMWGVKPPTGVEGGGVKASWGVGDGRVEPVKVAEGDGGDKPRHDRISWIDQRSSKD